MSATSETAQAEAVAAEIHECVTALNNALYDAANLGLRVEIETAETKVFDSPNMCPFQRVSVWRGDERLTSVPLPGDGAARGEGD